MDRDTFYERLSKLMQKSRKALRLYSSVGMLKSEGNTAEFSEVQVKEWRNINSELLRQLSHVMERPNSRTLVSEVMSIRDYFYGAWRGSETDLHQKQRDLIAAAENGDFVRAAVLSNELVTVKARMQAAQAAHHEFNEVIRRSRTTSAPIELSDDHAIPEVQAPKAKVIPLRRA